MSRRQLVGVVFVNDDDIGVVDLEERDRDHQGASELEGVVLGEGEIVRHLRAPSLSEADPRSMAPSVSDFGRGHREGEAKRPQLAGGPLVG